MINKAVQLKQELDKLRPISPEMEQRIMQKFRLDWNYHSNNLEGNSLTFGETKALILFGITANGKPLREHDEIVGHDEAIKWILEIIKQDRPLSEMFIRELHKLILKAPYKSKAKTPDGKPTTKTIQIGVYKTNPNHVETATGEMFYFATPEETPAKMADLVKWYRTEAEKEDVNPIILAAQFHYKFIRIHPFDDGNGRTARILMNFILMQFNYPPVIIKTEDKENYFAALRQADADIFEPFVNYIAENLVHSLEIMLKGAKGEPIDEPDDIDKEITLLKASLNEEEKTRRPKNEDNILQVIDKVTIPLFYKFEKKCRSLNELFLDKKINVGYTREGSYPSFHYINNINKLNTSFLYDNLLNNKIKDLQKIHLDYEYIGLKKLNVVTNFKTYLEIYFSKYQYFIVIDNNAKIKKYYNETLDETEMNHIVNTLIREVIQDIKEVTKLKN